MSLRPAVFLDRDGVLIEDVGYLAEPAGAALLPGAGQAVAELTRAGLPIVVVTNQSGVARGLVDEARLPQIHARIDELLFPFGARVDRYYYCPHHPRIGSPPYRADCDCRKPRPGMLLRAARELGLDLPASVIVGDKLSDLQAGAAVGCRLILVRTGYGRTTERQLEQANSLPDSALAAAAVVDSLAQAVGVILQ